MMKVKEIKKDIIDKIKNEIVLYSRERSETSVFTSKFAYLDGAIQTLNNILIYVQHIKDGE